MVLNLNSSKGSFIFYGDNPPVPLPEELGDRWQFAKFTAARDFWD
jgi:hypothetical protein